VNSLAWNGHDLLAALKHSAATLNVGVDEVNALNVFPVPDGDTGSNMLATVHAALAEADNVPELERSVARVAAALSLGALMGARGNSGVILSQLFRGLGEAVSGVDEIGGRELAEALKQGCEAAFSAVAHPVEGTILTVVRDASTAAAAALVANGSLEHVLAAAVAEASASVARTPSMLPILKSAGVVDAGGKGLELLLAGALASVHGETAPHVARITHDIPLPALDAIEADGYGYETVFIVVPRDGERLDIEAIRHKLSEIGESVLVAGDASAVKVHVHNEHPDQVIAYGLGAGTLSRISVENLDRQATAVREHAMELSAATSKISAVDGASNGVGPAIVAVAPGDGWAELYATLGAAAIVDGGQGSNPSAGELAQAIRGTNASQVIVLANNPNVRLAARQAGALVPDVVVEVVPSRNPAEGVAALLAVESDVDLKTAVRTMADAAERIQTLQVTAAVRDARMGRRRVKRGDYIVLGPSEGLVASDHDLIAAVTAAVGTLKPGFELVTLYRGRAVDQAAAERMRDALTDALHGVEVELVDGGQPHYDFVIAAE
jgi:DAK2 domain fusion protein YloV